MRGENDPWMFHQANPATSAAGSSLLGDLLDGDARPSTLARATFPIVSPTMDELAQQTKARMRVRRVGRHRDARAGREADRSGRRTPRRIPVTGLCTPAAEAYAGQQISYLQLGDGQSITLSLADCNAEFNPTPPTPTAGDGSLPPGPTVGGNCPPATGTGGTGGAGGGGGRQPGTGGAGGDTTMGSLSTDAGTDPGAYGGGGGGCGCALPGRGPTPGAITLVVALAIAVAGRRRRGKTQASCAMRPSLSGRSMR